MLFVVQHALAADLRASLKGPQGRIKRIKLTGSRKFFS
jgi:hypothetical protein